MALSFVGHSSDITNTNGTENFLSVTAISGLNDGDLMLAVVVYPQSYTLTPPTTTGTWTLVNSYNDSSGGGFKSAVYRKFANSDTVTLTWNMSGTSGSSTIDIVAFRGTDQTTGIDAHSVSGSTVTSANQTAPTITTTVDGCAIFTARTGFKSSAGFTFSASSPTNAGTHLADVGTFASGVGVRRLGSWWDATTHNAGSGLGGYVIATTSSTTTDGTVMYTVAIAPGATSANAGAATAIGAAYSATVAIGANAGSAAATAAAYVASSGKNAGSAAATASAKQPTVSTTPQTDASAGLVSVTATAQPTKMDYAPAGCAQATASGQAPVLSVGDQAGIVLAASAAYKPSMGFGVSAGVARATAVGGASAVGLALNVGVAQSYSSAYSTGLYYGSSRTIEIGPEIRLRIMEAEDRTLMVEES